MSISKHPAILAIAVLLWFWLMCLQATSVQPEASERVAMSIHRDLERQYQQILAESGNAKNGNDLPKFADSLERLAAVLWQQREFANAMKTLRKAEAVRVDELHEAPSALVDNLQLQACVLRDQQQFADARKMLERVKAIHQTAGDKAAVARDLNNIGVTIFLSSQKESSEAVRAAGVQKARGYFADAGKILSAAPVDAGVVDANVACAAGAVGDVNAARAMQKKLAAVFPRFGY